MMMMMMMPLYLHFIIALLFFFIYYFIFLPPAPAPYLLFSCVGAFVCVDIPKFTPIIPVIKEVDYTRKRNVDFTFLEEKIFCFVSFHRSKTLAPRDFVDLVVSMYSFVTNKFVLTSRSPPFNGITIFLFFDFFFWISKFFFQQEFC